MPIVAWSPKHHLKPVSFVFNAVWFSLKRTKVTSHYNGIFVLFSIIQNKRKQHKICFLPQCKIQIKYLHYLFRKTVIDIHVNLMFFSTIKEMIVECWYVYSPISRNYSYTNSARFDLTTTINRPHPYFSVGFQLVAYSRICELQLVNMNLVGFFVCLFPLSVIALEIVVLPIQHCLHGRQCHLLVPAGKLVHFIQCRLLQLTIN